MQDSEALERFRLLQEEKETKPNFGFPQEVLLLRGDATPGMVGRSMKVKSDGDHFVGFFAGDQFIEVDYFWTPHKDFIGGSSFLSESF